MIWSDVFIMLYIYVDSTSSCEASGTITRSSVSEGGIESRAFRRQGLEVQCKYQKHLPKNQPERSEDKGMCQAD